MTPREPDRSYDAGHDLWKRLQGQGTSNQIGILIAALRRERDDALNEAAQIIAWIQPEYTAHEAQRQIRALAHPAAAPAAETCPHCKKSTADHDSADQYGCGWPLTEPVARLGVCNFSTIHHETPHYREPGTCVDWTPSEPVAPAEDDAAAEKIAAEIDDALAQRVAKQTIRIAELEETSEVHRLGYVGALARAQKHQRERDACRALLREAREALDTEGCCADEAPDSLCNRIDAALADGGEGK